MSHRSRIGILLASLVGVGALATGCGVVSKVKQTVHTVEGNRATIDSFTQNLQSTDDTPFEATYTTTGSSPATVVYAVDPSSKGLAFHETQTGSDASNVQVIVNSSGEYVCNQSGSAGAWSCQKLGQADAATENKIFDIYTPSHWIAFLKGVSLVAGLGRRQGDDLDHVAQRLRHAVRRSRGQGGAGHQHHLQHVAGHSRLRQGGVGLDELPDHELLVVARAVAVPAAARRHRHDDHDLRPDPTAIGVRTQ